jgi:hypothetical protein
MGLLVKFNDGDTNYRSLPFGRDRLNGGSSNQPYIQIPLPENSVLNPIDFISPQISISSNATQGLTGLNFTQGNLFPYLNSVIKSGFSAIRYNSQSWGPDFLNRGNLYGFIRATDDVKRLTKYFFDTKSASALLFVAKQEILSKAAVRTEASKGLFNEGTYTPLSTIAQAGVSILGFHLRKQGLDPTGTIQGLSIQKYQDAIITEQNLGNPAFANSTPAENRLYNLVVSISSNEKSKEVKGFKLNNEDILISYKGGPGSLLGIGTTKIRFATSNTNVPIKTLANTAFGNNPKSSLYKTWNYKTFTGQSTNESPQITPDFRQILDPEGKYQNTFLSISPNYVNKNIETRLKLGDPGARKNRSNYDKGAQDISNNAPLGALDKITAYPIYKSTSADGSRYYGHPESGQLQDIIPFFIGILNNDIQAGEPNTYKKYLHFRAFIDDISDSYNADWKSIEYMGRAEKFYKYSGFDRKMSLSFTVVAQSRGEINEMYNKLNFLASSLAPEYLDSMAQGYMTGNIAYLTVGGYIYEQPGIITSLDFDIPEESPWEIGIDIEGNDTQATEAGRKEIRQLPHIIRVQLKFTPIHKFRPEKVVYESDVDENGKPVPNSTKIGEIGPQLFIDQRRKEKGSVVDFVDSKIESSPESYNYNNLG